MTARLRLPNKVCIITGAAGGIGLETAHQFAAEGARLVLADVNESALASVVKSLDEKYPGSEAVGQKCDVSIESQVKGLVDLAVEKFGRLDVIFNNAGIMHPEDDDAINTPDRIWDLTHNINVKGVWYGCKHALIQMQKNKPDPSKGLGIGGSIINVASFVALMGAATPQLAYTASKGAVLAMTRELAMVHARQGIRCNALCPGPLKTPLLMTYLNTPEKLNRRMQHIPMGRFGEAVEQAKAVVFLASDDSSYVNGTDFIVDGGIHACYVTPEGERRQ